MGFSGCGFQKYLFIKLLICPQIRRELQAAKCRDVEANPVVSTMMAVE